MNIEIVNSYQCRRVELTTISRPKMKPAPVIRAQLKHPDEDIPVEKTVVLLIQLYTKLNYSNTNIYY